MKGYFDFSTIKNVYKVAYVVGETIFIRNITEIVDLLPFPDIGCTCNITITNPLNEITTINYSDSEQGTQTYKFNSSGIYTIKYSGNTYYKPTIDTTLSEEYSCTYTITAVENKLPLKPWSITDVINRLLDLCEPIRQGEKPRFRLNGMDENGNIIPEGQAGAGQAARFDKILAPQFALTRQTLRECLQEIGRFIHGEPRLKIKKDNTGKYYYEVIYDLFSSQEGTDRWFTPYVSKGVEWAINNYQTWVDSNAENLVNQLDKLGGVIVEPYDGGAKSVRTENQYVRITDDNMLIATQYPIYTVEKLEYVYSEGGVTKTADITPYLFERSEYDTRLSSYQGQYPYSKAYALFFGQGERNIGGLSFKEESASTVEFKNYAIVNILKQVLDDGYQLPDYPLLAFRVTYTPIYNVRVAQTKPNYKDFKYPAALIVNQQSNVIESRYFGENLKGITARLGNVEKSFTYCFKSIKKVPKAGALFGKDYYLSAIATELLPTYVRCTVGISKDFNRLSSYIGVPSEKRYYEISSKQAVDRNVLYREYIVVGELEQPDDDSLIGFTMLQYLAQTFTNTEALTPITHVRAWGTSYKDNDLPAVDLPVVSSAFGNSISFSWRYDNNYSAGAIAQRVENSVDSGNQKITGYWQTDARYTDYYGRIYYYNFSLETSGAGYSEDESLNLPQGTVPTGNKELISTIGKSPYIMRKDNREALQVNFQIDFVTNLENLIIGSALASFCPAVRGTNIIGGFIKSETFSNGQAYINSNDSAPYDFSTTYLVLINNSVYVTANVESETDGGNTDFYLVISPDSEYKNYSGSANIYERIEGARLYVFDTELNKFTDHVEAYENVDLSKMQSVPVTVDVQNGYFTVNADAFPKTETGASTGKSWAIITPQTRLSAQEVEDEYGNVSSRQETVGGDLLIGRNEEVTAGQQFTPIYFTKKREIFDKSVWVDIK